MDTEASTVERARAGDRQAFEELYRRYRRPVFLYLVGCLRWREDAEDAFQTAFVSAWRSLPSLDEPGRFPPWLFRIARNAARDILRKRRSLPSSLPVPEDRLDARDPGHSSAQEVSRLLASLKPETRALVLLLSVQGWSTEAAGAAFSCSAATIRRRYARALEALKSNSERSNGRDPRS